jgi:amidase
MKVMDEAITILKQQGAIVVDPVEIPSIVSTDPQESFLLWNVCSGLDNAKGKDAACSIVFKYGMKRDFNKWLASLGATAPVKTLTELRQWNIAHQRAGALKYGQALLDISDEMNVDFDAARYRADREKDLRLSATNGIDAAMKKYQLDALLFPGPNSAAIAAKPGYPTVIVPFGLVPNAPPSPAPPYPEGFAAKPNPYGVGFTGLACSEAKLIELAYAFEQATRRRIPPSSTP